MTEFANGVEFGIKQDNIQKLRLYPIRLRNVF